MTTTVNSPRMSYVGIPSGTILAKTVSGQYISTTLKVCIGDEETLLAHDCGSDDCDSWTGQSSAFGDVWLCTDANGWVMSLGLLPELTIRLTEMHTHCDKCSFPLLGAFLVDKVPATVRVDQVFKARSEQPKACCRGTCQR